MNKPVDHSTTQRTLIEGWSRDGFLGARAGAARSNYSPDYISVRGPHAPRRLMIGDIDCADALDPWALPTLFATAKSGLRLAVSKRSTATPFVLRNVEADEVHFIQEGEVEFLTDFGALTAGPGDFVCLPRCVAYRVLPRNGAILSLITESPGALKFDTPSPAGMINFGQHVHHGRHEAGSRADAPTVLLLKCEDEITRFEKAFDPLATERMLAPVSPVWKLNLAHIQPLTYWPHGGPPSHFLASPGNELLFYTLSSRPGGRPPIHVNADYEEIIHYFRGPDPWGAIGDPGTWTWMPKGVPHQGPAEHTERGYLAWMLESRATLRLNASGLAASTLMETGMYGHHPTGKGL